VNKNVYIIVPAYNEATVIADVLRDLLKTGYSIVVIDDASSDGTAEIVKEFPVHYLKHKINMGQGAALQTGITFALSKGADYFVTFDADGQHITEDIPTVLEMLYSGNEDIVFGSRFIGDNKPGATFTRKLLLHFARYLNFLLTGILLTDAHNGLRAFNRKTASLINIRENRMAHATELLMKVAKYKLKYAEVSVHINYTSYSVNKGQKSFHSFKVLQDIFLYKIFK
jgi:polyprenyl-phospho-N-acetylgalactosaminyl synthase